MFFIGNTHYMCGFCFPGSAPRDSRFGAAVKNLFSSCEDFSVRPVALGRRKIPGELLWLDGCVCSRSLSEEVVRPLSLLDGATARACRESALRGGIFAAPGPAECASAPECARKLSEGCAALLLSGEESALVFEVRSEAVRGVEAPTVEKSVLGAKDAFVETLRTNTGRLRRRLPTPALKLEEFTPGREAPTAVALLYLEGTAPRETVERLRARLRALDLPAVTGTGEVERALAAAPRSAFPQCLHTERPDVFIQGLLRGKAGILLEGVPVGLLLPASGPELLRVGEDEARHAPVQAALTVLRALGLLLSLLLPAVYTAAAMYHPEMIPLTLLRSLIRAKEAVPFSTAAEVLGMLVSFELLQEAGVRLPEPVGQTVSVIGALIVGQSAVEAKVLSPIVIIVVALAGIGGYAQPSQELGSAVRLWRGILVILAAALGLFGVMAGCLELLRRLCDTENLSVAYLSPLCDRGWRKKGGGT